MDEPKVVLADLAPPGGRVRTSERWDKYVSHLKDYELQKAKKRKVLLEGLKTKHAFLLENPDWEIHPRTLDRAIRFVEAHLEATPKELIEPLMGPAPEGSIDIVWKLPKASVTATISRSGFHLITGYSRAGSRFDVVLEAGDHSPELIKWTLKRK